MTASCNRTPMAVARRFAFAIGTTILLYHWRLFNTAGGNIVKEFEHFLWSTIQSRMYKSHIVVLICSVVLKHWCTFATHGTLGAPGPLALCAQSSRHGLAHYQYCGRTRLWSRCASLKSYTVYNCYRDMPRNASFTNEVIAAASI
jgi:hypothetical protein